MCFNSSNRCYDCDLLRQEMTPIIGHLSHFTVRALSEKKNVCFMKMKNTGNRCESP